MLVRVLMIAAVRQGPRTVCDAAAVAFVITEQLVYIKLSLPFIIDFSYNI